MIKTIVLCLMSALSAAAFEDSRHKPETRYVFEEYHVHDCAVNSLALQVSGTQALRVR